MKKEEFISNLKSASLKVCDFTTEYVTNNLSKRILYSIKPNQLKESEHLSSNEINILRNLIPISKKEFTLEGVADLLVIQGLVPVWINCSVIKSTALYTLIELTISRRFRDLPELYHQEPFPPFSINVQCPPYVDHAKKEKFNVNWRNRPIETWIRTKLYRYRQNRAWKKHYRNIEQLMKEENK